MYAYSRAIGGEFSGRCVSKRIRAARSAPHIQARVAVRLRWFRPKEILTHFFTLVFYLQLDAKREPTSGLEPMTYNLITSDNSCVAGVCMGLPIPLI